MKVIKAAGSALQQLDEAEPTLEMRVLAQCCCEFTFMETRLLLSV